jgi:hypothetical protein
MDLGELLNQVREFYLDHFRQVVKEKWRLPGARIVTEPALHQPGGQAARQGALKLPLRTDLVIRAGSAKNSMQVATEKALGFDPVTLDWGTLKIELVPFQWERCYAQVRGLPAQTNWLPLVDWYERWFDEFDRKAALKKDFQFVVHGMEDPLTRDGATNLTVDFGSAPTAAFEEFLDTLAKMGATSGQIGEVQKNGHHNGHR